MSLIGLSAIFSPILSSQTKVLVIDEGIDLSHVELKSLAHLNNTENSGQVDFDDDQNGFIDDVSGWNAVSNDPHFFPKWIQEVFESNPKMVTSLFELYDRIEDGDEEAQRTVSENEKVARALSTLLGWSHGTHVGGIVSKNGTADLELASTNVFSHSDENGASSSAITHSASMSIDNYLDAIRRYFSESEELKSKSFFDDTQNIELQLEELKKEEQKSKQLLSRYTNAYQAKVVNLSLGSPKIRIHKALHQIWVNELKKQGKLTSTKRNAVQQKNFEKLLDGSFEIFRSSWSEIFAQNPNTLFVVAAGNDGGDPFTKNSGDNGINEVVPANCSRDFLNVITVAASNKEGLLADFSNFNPKFVNVAAWGTAVPSLAPHNNKVKMSGTSMASPTVAGLASKIIEINTDLNPKDVRLILEGTVQKTPSLLNKVSSQGMVHESTALDAAYRSRSMRVMDAISAALKARRPSINPLNIMDFHLFNQPTITASSDTHKTSSTLKRLIEQRERASSPKSSANIFKGLGSSFN